MNAGLSRSLSIWIVFSAGWAAPESRTASPGTAGNGQATVQRLAEEDIMHPMFVKLFLEPDADDLLADEEEQRRRAARARHTRSRMTLTVTTRAAAARPADLGRAGTRHG